METIKLRKKIIQQFDTIIKDDNRLIALEGVLDALEPFASTSKIPDEHYNTIQESRESYLKGNVDGMTWEEVKQQLISKYGL